MKSLISFRSILLISVFHLLLSTNSFAVRLVNQERKTLHEVAYSELTTEEKRVLAQFFDDQDEITREEIRHAIRALNSIEPASERDHTRERLAELIAKLDPEHEPIDLPASRNSETPLWSIYDPSNPPPQPPQVRSWFIQGMGYLDRMAGSLPRTVQEWLWYYISPTASECPRSNIIGGEFSTLCEKGLLRFILDKLASYQPNADEPWLTFRIGPVSMMVPLDIDLTLKILRSKGEVYRGMAYDRLVDFFGYGIFTSRDYDRWKYQRKIAEQLFHTQSLEAMTTELYALLLEEIRKAHLQAEGKKTDLVLLLSRVGLLAFCDSVLGIDVREQADILAPAVNHVLAYINGALEPIQIPFDSHQAEFKKNIDIVHHWMLTAIKQVREAHLAGRAPQNPLVDAIVNIMDKNRQDEVIEFTLSMVLGGHETTARLMLGALYSLMQHPHYIEQIRTEVDQYLPDETSEPKYRELRKNLPRLDTVVKESLRLYPPVWLLGRTPKKDLSINGKTILAGTEILISPLILHRLSTYWGEDAEIFRPERFDNLTDAQRYKIFLPFVAGDERCPGRDFAELEAKLLIAGLLKHFDIQLADPSQRPDPTSAGTFRLFQTLDVVLSPRAQN